MSELEDIEDMVDVVKCTNHGWMVDCRSMTYVEPTGTGMVQEECIVVREEDGSWSIYDLQPAQPWETIGQDCNMQVEELEEGEVTVTYFSHACVEIKLGDKTLVTDPWLLGPAFMRGWWLSHVPPEVPSSPLLFVPLSRTQNASLTSASFPEGCPRKDGQG